MGMCGLTCGKKPSYHRAVPLVDEHRRTARFRLYKAINPGHLENIPTELKNNQLKSNGW